MFSSAEGGRPSAAYLERAGKAVHRSAGRRKRSGPAASGPARRPPARLPPRRVCGALRRGHGHHWRVLADHAQEQTAFSRKAIQISRASLSPRAVAQWKVLELASFRKLSEITTEQHKENRRGDAWNSLGHTLRSFWKQDKTSGRNEGPSDALKRHGGAMSFRGTTWSSMRNAASLRSL